MNGTRSKGAQLLAERLQQLLQPATPAPLLIHARTAAAPGAGQGLPLPGYVEQALGRLHLLSGVPFGYLAPDSRLLPPESIRFFTLDPEWLDALVQGALAVGSGCYERALTQTALPKARLAAVRQVPFVRDVARGRVALELAVATALEEAPTETIISGFLLRSGLVSGWPAMSVRAWASDDPADIPLDADPTQIEVSHPELVVPILRLERLAPSVLLALFDGLPRLIWLEEPHHGVQFGLNQNGADWRLALRDERGNETGADVAVPMRSGTIAGVVDITGLAQALDAARPLAHQRGSAALALQLLQPPARQRFTASAADQPLR